MYNCYYKKFVCLVIVKLCEMEDLNEVKIFFFKVVSMIDCLVKNNNWYVNKVFNLKSSLIKYVNSLG